MAEIIFAIIATIAFPFILTFEIGRRLWTETKDIPWWIWIEIKSTWAEYLQAMRNVSHEIKRQKMRGKK